jgi:penicillin-binding protein 1C
LPCALDARAAFIVGDILADSNARARTFGGDSVLGTRFWSAVKTGTSKDMRDNWAIGYSARYTVGVWVGNASGAPMWDVSGTSGAAPIWASVMRFLHRDTPSRAPQAPPGLVRQAVTFPRTTAPATGAYDTALGIATATEAGRMEWFIQGTEQSQFALSAGDDGAGPARVREVVSSARITSPANGSIIALDPDIPPDRQRLRFGADGPVARWLMDGKPFAKGSRALWLPWPGRHVVQIVGAQGEVLDSIRLEVRGAGVTGTH